MSKQVEITANELDQAEKWLKDVDHKETSLPMLLASYAHDIKLSKYPALNNLSDEISRLTDKIKNFGSHEFVLIRLSEYNNLRDFKSSILSRLHSILGTDEINYNKLSVYDLCDAINKSINSKNQVDKKQITYTDIAFFIMLLLFFIIGAILGKLY